MGETAIFIIGAIVFAMTVYGSVMAAGLALTRVEIEQDPRLLSQVDGEKLEGPLPDVEY